MTAIRADELDEVLVSLLREAAELGREAERAAIATDRKIVARRGVRPEVSEDDLVARLRDALESEIVIAKRAHGDREIEEREKHREIAKRALVHIKLPVLRDIAESLSLPRTGKLEEVLDRIVRFLRADEEAIARLIIEFESEPPPDRRLATRIFLLSEPLADLRGRVERIGLFAGSYLRVGIAKWFVIDDLRLSGSTATMSGTYRYYSADADRAEDETYRLRASRQGANVALRVAEGRRFVEIEAKAEPESRAALAAFCHAGAVRPFEGLPIDMRGMEGELFRWDPQSVLFLELLQNNFRSDHVSILNLNSAGFDTGETLAGEDDDASRPAVRAVRFSGQHLLDSRPACELLVAGQALVELGFTARVALSDSEAAVLPVTVRFHKDHVAVFTGFGIHAPQIAAELQRQLMDGIEKTLIDGVVDPASLNRLAEKVRERARQDEPVQRADLFADPGPSASSS